MSFKSAAFFFIRVVVGPLKCVRAGFDIQLVSQGQNLKSLRTGPNWGGGGIKSKGLEMGKKMKSLKKRKKKNFEVLTVLVVPKGKILILQHNLTLFKPILYCSIALWERKP